jgi:hypothetical protein
VASVCLPVIDIIIFVIIVARLCGPLCVSHERVGQETIDAGGLVDHLLLWPTGRFVNRDDLIPRFILVHRDTLGSRRTAVVVEVLELDVVIL